MIYASDLDQTLIYSTRSMGAPLDSHDILPAESVNGKIVSYMSRRTLSLLQSLPPGMGFVPVTTRTIAQYERIHLFRDHVVPAYAVTSNGGNILLHGQVDEEWRAMIREKVSALAADAVEARSYFEPLMNDQWVVGERFCDELFYAFVIQRDLMPLEAVMEKAEQVKALGWEVSIQGRKIYLVPSVVNKADAVNEVRRRLGINELIASGDSILDQCLLELADYAIAPSHGELFREKQRNPGAVTGRFTAGSGIFAADEILDYVHSVYQTKEAVKGSL
ncbi:hydrolase [Paenibacillus nasutitermitis]|uniref:Hydrolase n=1 Tax=Paenibacillus nasutitermitis TaxID=1652958 RepID=A0A916ZBU1_9BACL|nr:hydrolase [Paenibacillus nasutitermitis]GGD87201.1 hypothetical protein GCM10010911_52030 [Paenibacillus nasutitermitis]